MAELVERKRSHVAAVTDGRRLDGAPILEDLVRVLRDEGTYRHLRPVA